MISVKIEGAAALQSKLKTYGRAVNKEAGDMVREIANLGARNLASNTFPKGTTGKVKSILVKSILKDLHRAYMPARKSNETDDGRFLKSRRGPNGRVAQGKKKYISSKSFDDIRKRKEHSAGEVKAAWLASGKDLGKGRIPAWLKKRTSKGFARIQGAGFKMVITLLNKVRYSANVITPADITKSTGMAYKGYIKFIDRKMKALAKRV
jgi:hypothetical protein